MRRRIAAWLHALAARLVPQAPLSAAEKAEARKLFTDKAACLHCGGVHARACPRIKRLVFSTSGSVAEVEFWPHGDWPQGDVIWPEDVQDEEREGGDG